MYKRQVRSIDDNTTGPELPQNTGSWAFNTIDKPALTIGDAYATQDETDTEVLMTPLDEATVWVEITTDMKDARGLTVSDFIISGGCIGALHVITENRIWRLEISIAENTKGFLTVAIPSNVVSEGNDPEFCGNSGPVVLSSIDLTAFLIRTAFKVPDELVGFVILNKYILLRKIGS